MITTTGTDKSMNVCVYIYTVIYRVEREGRGREGGREKRKEKRIEDIDDTERSTNTNAMIQII